MNHKILKNNSKSLIKGQYLTFINIIKKFEKNKFIHKKMYSVIGKKDLNDAKISTFCV